jgi:hypothetical protein
MSPFQVLLNTDLRRIGNDSTLTLDRLALGKMQPKNTLVGLPGQRWWVTLTSLLCLKDCWQRNVQHTGCEGREEHDVGLLKCRWICVTWVPNMCIWHTTDATHALNAPDALAVC